MVYPLYERPAIPPTAKAVGFLAGGIVTTPKPKGVGALYGLITGAS